MFVRHRHVVVFGAQRAFGHRLVEALLALGAHVIAVGPLRTELEALRAEMRQHHHLHVAECSPDRDGPARLLEATLRRGHVDAVVFVADQAEATAAERDALARAVDDLCHDACGEARGDAHGGPSESNRGDVSGGPSESNRGDAARGAHVTLPLLIAQPAESAHGELAQHGETRDGEPILYDPADPAPAVSRMLMRLSSPRAERARP